jgi:5'/3'-nucleotidase
VTSTPTCGRIVLLWGLVASALSAAPARAQSADYHILITNDDGIESPGIQALAATLAELGQVHVVAPCGEESGAGMSVALRDELHLRAVEKDGMAIGDCVDTTPAGAALLAITTLAPEGGYDLVVSGINRGANVGTASHMSGTVGAAMMGAMYGIPAVAVSLGDPRQGYDFAAAFTARFVEEMRTHEPVPGVVFSINLPRGTAGGSAGVAVAPMGGIHLTFAYDEGPATDGARVFRPRIAPANEAPVGSDTEAYFQGKITITPLAFDWTARDVLGRLRGWDLAASAGEDGR